MIVSLKDSLKLIGISIVCFCAVFVCTFFLNYYIDVLPLKDDVLPELMQLYTAQLATAKMTCGITGGFLSVIAVIMLLFYINLYIDQHRKTIGILKAMGYSNLKIAKSFLLFGLSVFLGCGSGFAIGWAFMPNIYKSLTIDGLPVVSPSFLSRSSARLFGVRSDGRFYAYLVFVCDPLFAKARLGADKGRTDQNQKGKIAAQRQRSSILKRDEKKHAEE